MTTRPKHAGGRPTLIEGERLQRVTVTLPAELVAWARTEGRGNLSAGLRQLLEELDQRQGADHAS